MGTANKALVLSFFFLHSCVLPWRPLPFCLGCYAIRPKKSLKAKQSNPPQSLRPDWGIDMCCLLPTQRSRRFITVSSWSNATAWQCLWFNEVTFYLASYHQGIACHWEVSDSGRQTSWDCGAVLPKSWCLHYQISSTRLLSIFSFIMKAVGWNCMWRENPCYCAHSNIPIEPCLSAVLPIW